MTTSGIARVLSAALLATTLLPYSGPGVCTMLGRMGADTHEMTMASRTGGPALEAPGSMTECCSIDGCGVPHAGPAAFSFPLPGDFHIVAMAPHFARPTPPQMSPDPVTRPPRA